MRPRFQFTPIVTVYYDLCFQLAPRPGFHTMDRVVNDPHQSPIWFKAKLPVQPVLPLAHVSPRNSSVPWRLQLFCHRSVVANQPRDGCRHRRIKYKNREWVRTVPNHTRWIFTRPQTGSLPHPNLSSKQFF